MKNFLIGLNIVLLLLVGYLYYLHFSSSNSTGKGVMAVSTDSTTHLPNKIGYIDLDTLQEHYKYYKKVKDEFERKQKAGNNEMTALQNKFQKRTNELQDKAANMTPQEQENAMMEINKMQQDFQNRKIAIDNELFEYNTKIKDDVLSRIQNFLKDYNKNGKYTYIFSYEPEFMFYKDSTLDITADVIKGLNELYDAEQKK
ncbi:MAG: OmpH family outer membrane protein [Chitinophagaceae bacterium]|nr:OmpH family outer membrane protein [Chitinophagaceae bacterium]